VTRFETTKYVQVPLSEVDTNVTANYVISPSTYGLFFLQNDEAAKITTASKNPSTASSCLRNNQNKPIDPLPIVHLKLINPQIQP